MQSPSGPYSTCTLSYSTSYYVYTHVHHVALTLHAYNGFIIIIHVHMYYADIEDQLRQLEQNGKVITISMYGVCA